MRKLFITVLLLLSCQTFSQVQEYNLQNGLKILIQEDHRAPIVVSMIWYNVGSADEPGGITGVSHAIEHLMFKGTPRYPLGVFSKTIAAIGGQSNAFTNNDYTAFYEKTAASQLGTLLELEADRMQNLLLDPQEFSREIKVIQEERRLRTDDNPQALAFERFFATAHLSAPYHHPVIGWMHDLQQMTVNDVKKWYQTYYAPNNATLVIVGDVQADKVHQLAQKYFGAIPARKIPKRKSYQEPPSLGPKEVRIENNVKLPIFMAGYLVPGITTADKPYEPYALELIAGILDAGESARFAKKLIRGSHIASGASTYYNLYARYQTQFIVYGAPSQQGTLAKLQSGLFEELEDLKKNRVSEKELQRIKNQIIAQKVYEKDSIFGQANEIGLLETVGLGWKKAEQYTQAINEITPQQIQDTARHYFQEQNRTIATLVPRSKE